MVRAAKDSVSAELEGILAGHYEGVGDARLAGFCAKTAGGAYALPDRDALELWFGNVFPLMPNDLRCLLAAEIARLDRQLNELLNAILHHPRLQRLEASWRGLQYLVDHQTDVASTKIKVLNVSRRELWEDSTQAIEFDQTHLFKRVYENEFGMPGGEPFGLLLADFSIRHRKLSSADGEKEEDRVVCDVDMLSALAEVADAAFAPLVSAAHPELFGSDSDEGFDRRFEVSRVFAVPGYEKWLRFRASENSRFTGMVLPRVLMRLPYQNCTARNDRFPFEENVAGPYGETLRDEAVLHSHSARPYNDKLLWGNAVYAFGAVALRSFTETGWFEDVLGVQRDMLAGGLVSDLPVHWFETDQPGTAARFQTRALLPNDTERQLSEAGFIPLSHCRFSHFSAFYSCRSLHQPKKYTNPLVTRNAELSSRLNLLMCVSRFAHYLKVIVRDQVGRFTSAVDLENYLHRWIHTYVSADADMAPAVRARYPLRAASINVREVRGKPGEYICVAHLQPHVHGEYAVAGTRLVMQLPSGKSTLVHSAQHQLAHRVSQSV